MKDRVTKNYFTDGGDTLVIGGKLQVEEGAEVIGIEGGGGSIPVASADTLGGVKVGARLSIDENGVLSAEAQTPGAATKTTAGVVRQAAFVPKESLDLVGVETYVENVVNALVAAGVMAPAST